MSRSYKKAIWKDNGIGHRIYHRLIRRVTKQAIREGKEIPNPKTIINDYEYMDYWFKAEFTDDPEWKEKLSRK